MQGGIDHLLPPLRRHHQEQAVSDDAGIVDQDVNGLQPVADLVYRPLHLFPIADVEPADLPAAAAASTISRVFSAPSLLPR